MDARRRSGRVRESSGAASKDAAAPCPGAARAPGRTLDRNRPRCDDHVRRIAVRENIPQGFGFVLVDGQAVLALDRDGAGGKPGSVHRRQPLGRIAVALAASAAVVARGHCQISRNSGN